MGNFKKMAVIGDPVGHSKSPAIHGYWLDKYGIAGSYEAVRVAPENLRDDVRRLVEGGFTGWNVTVPHKETMLHLCDDLDDAARAIGAVNTVAVKDGRLTGFNTDAYGYMENLRREAPAYDSCEGTAMILGAGGAARAVAYGLMKDGCRDIVIVNRTEDKAKAVASLSPDVMRTAPWDRRTDVLSGANILVNTTSLGMKNMPPLDISLDALPQTATVSDIVYAPLMTDLLSAAEARGNAIVTGIGMLLYQAAMAFDIWHGVMPEVTDELRDKVLAS